MRRSRGSGSDKRWSGSLCPLCLCVCVSVCVCVCVCLSVCLYVSVRGWVCVCVCTHAYKTECGVDSHQQRNQVSRNQQHTSNTLATH